ncbi:MAG: DNA polymerase III subunit chi [Rickettsiaceae bacterium]
MIQVSCYNTTQELIIKTCCQLVEKCYYGKLNTCIILHNNDFLQELDKVLWTYSQKKFIPHATEHDPLQNKQPVYLTTSVNNPNQATAFLLINPTKETILTLLLDNNQNNDIQKILILNDGSQLIDLTEISNIISQSDFKSVELNHFEQTGNGNWQKRIL